eukprot:4332610-Amphidinium_carterae.1
MATSSGLTAGSTGSSTPPPTAGKESKSSSSAVLLRGTDSRRGALGGDSRDTTPAAGVNAILKGAGSLAGPGTVRPGMANSSLALLPL